MTVPKVPVDPTRAEWQALFNAALAFRDAEPWTWMTEDMNFGIRDPKTDINYYACIMGELGEHRALALYEDADGLSGLWRMRLNPPDNPFEILNLQHCLMMAFEDRDGLEQSDRDILKDIGIKVRGRGAWPLARSYRPDYVPWPLDGDQARVLALGLQQALLVAERCRTEPGLVAPAAAPSDTLLIRVQSPGGEWRDEFEVPDLSASAPDSASIVHDLNLLAELRALPKSKSVLEIDFMLMPAPVQAEPNERAFFPTVVMTGEQSSGLLLAAELYEPGTVAQGLAEQFLLAVNALQSRPEKVLVARKAAFAAVESAAAALSIRLARVKRLNVLDPALDLLFPTMLMDDLSLDPRDLEGGLQEFAVPESRKPVRSVRRASKSNSGPSLVYQLKVTLRGTRPPIWRRLLVASDTRLDKFHDILQAAMGWHDCHLHAFEADGISYGVPNPDLDMLDMENERRSRLDELLPDIGARLNYEYDFGDSWMHEVRLEKVLSPDPKVKLPHCVTGKRACPPEDCGGVWGYVSLLEALSDPNHPEHSDMVDWLEEPFDPAAFSVDEVNRRLRRVN